MEIKYEFDGLAKLEHTYKDVDFLIVIEEEMDVDNIHKCHTVFRTPKGKYRKDWLFQDEAIKDLPEQAIKEFACKQAYNWYEKAHGWGK